MNEHDVNGDRLHYGVHLDDDNCLSLASILEVFKRPINEEQAWALCYQTLKCIRSIGQPMQLYLMSDENYLFIHKDGIVHEKSLTFTNGLRKPVSCVSSVSALKQILSSFGITLFKALDYGIAEDEERVLHSNLEEMIERLATSDQLTNISECKEDSDCEQDLKDEGIERDSSEDECEEHFNLLKAATEEIMEMCISHVRYGEEANGYYKKICSALVSETIELSNCIEKICKGTKELRKSSVFIVNEKEEQRKVKKDAHELTLELIKSRPKLTPVSRRKLLPAPPKQQTPHERLMSSIRQDHKLRPIPRKFFSAPLIRLGNIVNGYPTKIVERNDTPCPQRRLIKPDFTFSLSISSEEEDESSIVNISLSDKCIESANECKSYTKESEKSSQESHLLNKKPLRNRFTDFFKYFKRSAKSSQQ